ncbi:MAG: hypothetical protein A2020_04090 [Lentisphaerae bacterium GWF2_45_14]|nr:MAG: hypothetical protein A2020_04090 [Lentisphaerae bacterium GWF2_45_14]
MEDGVYYDCVGVDAYQDGNDFTYPVFTLKEYLRRIYIAQRQLNPESITLTHSGADFSCPSVEFSDIILMGEQYRQGCFDYTYYLEFRTLRQFRAENAVNVGPSRMFLPQYRQREKMESPEVALHTLGLVMCHNLMLYPSFINQEIITRVRNFQYEFGMNDAEFFPYWEKNPYGIASSNPNVICSFYKNKKGFLLSLLNSTKDEQTFKLKVEDSLKGMKLLLFEPLVNKKSPISLDSEIKVKPYMAAFVLIEN